MCLSVSLTSAQIADLKKEANLSIDREIYSISFTFHEITINGDWTIQIASRNHFRNSLVSAIEQYCTLSNVEWELQAFWSAWCD